MYFILIIFGSLQIPLPWIPVRFGDLCYIFASLLVWKQISLNNRRFLLFPLLGLLYLSIIFTKYLLGFQFAYHEMFSKIVAIVLFYIVFLLGYSIRMNAIPKIAFFCILIVVIFSIIVNIIYYLGGSNWLSLFVCDVDRHQTNGIVRCGAFAEGSYLGSFLVLMLIFLAPTISNFLIVFSGIIISAAPLGFLGASIRFLTAIKLSFWKKMIICIVIGLCGLSLLEEPLSKISISAFQSGDVTGSTLERLELARIGILIFLDNFVVGVGPGQYFNYVASYTIFPNIVSRIVDQDFRYIANNVFAEISAEYGLFGVFLLYLLFKGVFYGKSRDLGAFIVIFLIYMVLPTFFVSWNALFLGMYLKAARTH